MLLDNLRGIGKPSKRGGTNGIGGHALHFARKGVENGIYFPKGRISETRQIIDHKQGLESIRYHSQISGSALDQNAINTLGGGRTRFCQPPRFPSHPPLSDNIHDLPET